MRIFAALLGISLTTSAQDPYVVAADHYHLLFENTWVRATRVTYGPDKTAPVHQHPPTPTTLYVYLTDSGVMRFRHVSGEHVMGLNIDRKPVLAEYLGDAPTEYVRIELRTEDLDRPTRDVRMTPKDSGFENGQVRILRVSCAERCPESEHLSDPAVVVALSGAHKGDVAWSPKKVDGPGEFIRLKLKSQPVAR